MIVSESGLVSVSVPVSVSVLVPVPRNQIASCGVLGRVCIDREGREGDMYVCAMKWRYEP